MPSPISTRDPDMDRLAIDTVRTLAMDAIEKAGSGHPGTAMALAPAAYVLWTQFLRYDPEDPEWFDRDRFILSAGHASVLQYAVLHLTGYGLTLDDLRQQRMWGSKTPGHPEFRHTAGVEVTTGPLGQGVGNGVGMAMAERLLASHFNRPHTEVINHRTWVFASDGDMMEGISAEASSLGGHLGLGKLTVMYDDNRITIDGTTEISFTEDIEARYRSYGWHVQHIDDANDLQEIARVFQAAVDETERPSFIRLRSHIAWGAPNAQDTSKAHGSALGEEEIRATKIAYGWDPDKHFFVPEGVHDRWHVGAERGAKERAEWRARMESYAAQEPELAADLQRRIAGELPEGWDQDLDALFANQAKPIATRVASKQVLNAVAKRLPELMGGSADLAESNGTHLEGQRSYERSEPGRIVHFGIREHAMGSACNGLALHGGVRPFAATFLIFSDYMRPSVRLASLMHIGVIYIWTHDSIGVGGDGPTHQPIEHLASLRAMPGLYVIRPADGPETAEAWRVAIGRLQGPTALILSRQNLPVIDHTQFTSAAQLQRGAYVLAEAESGTPDVLLLATGSEVGVALEARRRLQEQGIGARVVSMPCWELFDEQDMSYRDEVLPPSIRARVAVEAASPFGWGRWVGSEGAVVGIDHFGASANGEVLFEEFGFTPDNVVLKAKEVLARVQPRA